MPPIKVAVLVYPNVEVIDMNGPIDVFVKANLVMETKRYDVFTVAETADDIDTEEAVVHIRPRYSFSNCPKADIIVIPGQINPPGSAETFGSGTPGLIKWLQDQARDNKDATIMSVCVGAYILAKTNLLDNRRATTHWQAIETLQTNHPKIKVIKNVRYQEDGNYVTTGGVTSGIDGALLMVRKNDGEKWAQIVADTIVYNRDCKLPPNTILH